MNRGDSRTGAIIQARMGSTRLPGKSMRTIVGKPVLQHVVRRVRLSNVEERTYVATSNKSEDDVIADFCREMSIGVFRGSETNVLERFYLAAQQFDLSTVVRVTADNPLVGPDVIDFMVERHRQKDNHLTTGYHSRTFPNGTIVSVLDLEVLEYLYEESNDPSVREHIVTGLDLLSDRFKAEAVEAPTKWRRYDLRYCIDYEQDFNLVSHIIEHFSELGAVPSTTDIINYLDEHPEIKQLNRELAEQGY